MLNNPQAVEKQHSFLYRALEIYYLLPWTRLCQGEGLHVCRNNVLPSSAHFLKTR